MDRLDVLFIGSVMNYDGTTGSLANYIRRKGKWVAPFQYIYEKRSRLFTSESEACVYDIPNLSISELVDYLKRQGDLSYHIVWHKKLLVLYVSHLIGGVGSTIIGVLFFMYLLIKKQ